MTTSSTPKPPAAHHSYANINCYADCYTYTNGDCETLPSYALSPNPGSTPVTYAYEKETHCSIRFVQAECFNLFRTGLRSGHFRSCERHHGHEHQRQWLRLVAAGARRCERR